ncbi:MAG: DUF2784 family protein [bacterium]
MGRVYKNIADLVLAFHIFVVLMILLGWLLPTHLLWMYQTTVILTFLFGLLNRGTCILTEYEWRLRKKYNIGNYNDNLFIPYYLKKYLNISVSEKVWSIGTTSLITVSFIVQMFVLFR